MASSGSDRATKRGPRLARARRLAGQAKQDRSSPWYVPFAITSVGAGAAFDAFGRGLGFFYFYALGLAIAFVSVSWSTLRHVPSTAAELRIERRGRPRMLLTLANAPVTSRGSLVVAAAVPISVALVKTVGFYALGGAMIVVVVSGVALLVVWVLDRR